MNRQHTQSGFTIVETLVAITILMIAIAGPLSIASKSLNAALVARNQLIASYLAQESMEVIKNIRDNSLANGQPFLAGFTAGSCTSGQPCNASAVDSPKIVSGAASLNRNTSNQYTRGAGTYTGFTRRFYLTQVQVPPFEEYRVTVEVDWNEGTVPYQVRVTSALADTIR